MTISDSEYSKWLQKNDAIKCILIRATATDSGGSPISIFLSSRSYFSSILNTIFEPRIKPESVIVIETLNVPTDTGLGSFTIGDIRLNNADRGIDSYLDYHWKNVQMTVYLGDVTWQFTDFRLILTGIIEDVAALNENELAIRMSDKMERLRTAVTDTKLNGSTNNKDSLIPLCFGECHNVSPLLTNPSTLEFKVHDGAIEDIIEVRDEGVPVSVNKYVSEGRFTLNASPAGRITASIQGDKPSVWNTKIGDIIQRLVKDYGDPLKQFTSSDIDFTSFSNFNSLVTYPTGVYINSKDTVMNICSKLANSAGANLIISREGKLRIIRVTTLGLISAMDIYDRDIVAGSVRVLEKVDTKSSYILGYAKNWTVQTDLNTGIPAAHKDLYSKEWLTVKSTDATIQNIIKDDEEPDMIETNLLVESDAQTECNRLLTEYKNIRKIYEFKGTSKLLELNLGDGISVHHSGFDLNNKGVLMVVGLSLEWGSGTVTVRAFGA